MKRSQATARRAPGAIGLTGEESMNWRSSIVIGLAAVSLMGCTAIPLDQFEKDGQTGTGAAQCSQSRNMVDLDPSYPPAAASTPGKAGDKRSFSFLVPAGQKLLSSDSVLAARAADASLPLQNVVDFATFQQKLQERLNNSDLAPTIKNDAVLKEIFAILVKSFAQAQIDQARAQGYDVSDAQKAVNDVSTSYIGLRELKDFTQTVHDAMSHPLIGPPAAKSSAPPGDPATNTSNTFARYFADYYEGNFYDRFGNNVAKPTISTQTAAAGVAYTVQIPDSDIASALTVVIEYLVDLIDPTPVLTNMDLVGEQPPAGINYYPGAKPFTNEPEALKTGLANYRNIVGNACGITTTNAVLLYDVASAAGDATTTVSGLVSQSWGGVGISFFGLLKFSFGDNQTLATIVKTAAARLAQRVTLAASYWALDRYGVPAPAAGGAPNPPPSVPYLHFGM